MKRKADEDLAEKPLKKKSLEKVNGDGSTQSQLRSGLLQQAEDYQKQYSSSEPYKHGVIPSLVEPQLLRKVRAEIQENLSFTPKETDIYKIHQSGDLANLDGLDDTSLKLLPSLLTLRNLLYSPDFRTFLSTVTSSGPLSGKKTDMAINVYTTGCHLLCHDDVIGSRRVSYILYLTDPDKPWKPEWGGALRLYPTTIQKDQEGKEIRVPGPDHSVSISPAFNQLSFFAVQPGESYHDVEEVFGQPSGAETDDGETRMRMAISGWYHIPQEGEEGYVEGLEESLAERSSLQQLQGNGDQFEMPSHTMRPYANSTCSVSDHTASNGPTIKPPIEEVPLSEADLDFLLKYIAPIYLTPDTLDSVLETFGDECSICLEKFLSPKFSDALKTDIVKQEAQVLPLRTSEIESTTQWRVARPPYKHRFLYQQPSGSRSDTNSENLPLRQLLTELFPSEAFRKWLQLATGLSLSSHNLTTRRFRRGKDYTLATGYIKEESQLELIMAVTPTPGWIGIEDTANDIVDVSKEPDHVAKVATKEPPTADDIVDVSKEPDHVVNVAAKNPPTAETRSSEAPGVGGYIAYMAGDDTAEKNDEEKSNGGVEVPLDMSTGARASKPSMEKRINKKPDPAIYKTDDEEEDNGILFSMPPSWNTLGLVLRDQGVMRFVKYVSQEAKGDRWDILGEFGVIPGDEETSAVDECDTQQINDYNNGNETSETEIESSDEDSE
ncbi:MAG: hypothetical protein Q9223_000670 [Gallowayella weberi]